VFEDLIPVEGAEGEPIHAFLWRVVGPPTGDYEATQRYIFEHWMSDDACSQNQAACEALLALLGDDDEDLDE
jgi:hypothetical protein